MLGPGSVWLTRLAIITSYQRYRPLLKAKIKFCWSEELDRAFILSKREIVKAIEKGVEIFDINRRTCIRPNWSKTGIGFFVAEAL